MRDDDFLDDEEWDAGQQEGWEEGAPDEDAEAGFLPAEMLAEQPLIGHQQVIQHLEGLQAQGKMPHALLFSGQKGIGKATLAERFARMLLVGSARMDISWQHPVVSQMKAGSCADYLYISGENRGDGSREKAILIDREQIRAIDHFLGLTRSSAANRVIVIDGAEAMNLSAANALLKNLEEPPAHTVFLLISHNPARLLPTIRSRCRTVAFKPLRLEECQQVMLSLASGTDVDELKLMAALADNSPGLAHQWLQRGGFSLYQRICELFTQPNDQNEEIVSVTQLAEEITADRSNIHQRFQMLCGLLLAFFSRLQQIEPVASPAWEQAAIRKCHEGMTLEAWVSCWFTVQQQFQMAEGLHLDYRSFLTTLLLRLVRGKMPLSLKAS